MFTALSDGTIEVRATAEQTHVVLASHVQRTLAIGLAPERAGSTATVLFRAAKATEAVDVGPTAAARATTAVARVEATPGASVGIVVIVITTESRQQAHDGKDRVDHTASEPKTSRRSPSHDAESIALVIPARENFGGNACRCAEPADFEKNAPLDQKLEPLLP